MRFIYHLMPWDPAQPMQSWACPTYWVLGYPQEGLWATAPSVPQRRPKKMPCWLVFGVKGAQFNSQLWEHYLLMFSALQEKG